MKPFFLNWNQRNDSIHQLSNTLPIDLSNPAMKSTLEILNTNRQGLQTEVRSYVKQNIPGQESNDRDYIFYTISYIIYLRDLLA